MEELGKGKIWDFDHRFCNRNTQLLKILLWYTDTKMQPMISVMIKFMELKQCLYKPISFPVQHTDISSLYEDAKDYLSPEERDAFSRFQNMQDMMKQFREMSDLMEVMKTMYPNTDENTGDFSGFSTENLGSMLSPEFAGIFEMLKNLSPNDSSKT